MTVCFMVSAECLLCDWLIHEARRGCHGCAGEAVVIDSYGRLEWAGLTGAGFAPK